VAEVVFYPKKEQEEDGIDGFVAEQDLCPFCKKHTLFSREDLGDYPEKGEEGWYMQCGKCKKVFGCNPTTHWGMYFTEIK